MAIVRKSDGVASDGMANERERERERDGWASDGDGVASDGVAIVRESDGVLVVVWLVRESDGMAS